MEMEKAKPKQPITPNQEAIDASMKAYEKSQSALEDQKL